MEQEAIDVIMTIAKDNERHLETTSFDTLG